MKIDKIKSIDSLREIVYHMDKFGDRIVFERSSNYTPDKGFMIVGEAPGYEEVRLGQPFVGRSGKLLDKWLKVLGIDEFVITNVVKSHPVDESGYNRKPNPKEIEYWMPVLMKEINILKPKMIICLGDVAYRSLTNGKDTITSTIKSGKIFDFDSIPVIVYYHPSYLLRNKGYDWNPDIEKIRLKMERIGNQRKINLN